MRKPWLLGTLGLLLALLAGCGGQNTSPSGSTPLSELTANDDALYGAGQPLLEEAAAAFSDLMPQAQATAADPRPLTMAKDSAGNVVLIGGPWRPPFPWPIPPVDKPLFLVIKLPSCPGGCKPGNYMAILRQDPQSREYFLEWQGARGSAPVRVPARVEQQGDFSGSGKYVVKFSFKLIPPTIDMIIEKVPDTPTDPFSRMHIVAPLPPDTLPGRPLSGTLDSAGYEAKFKDVCCGRPKPFPPVWPSIWLHREDLSAVALPYDNPKVRTAQTLDELVGENLGFVYLRKKPFPGTTTDCGPNQVWCPPDTNPFLNLKLAKNSDGSYALQLTELANPAQVKATLPAQVSLNTGQTGPGHIDIEDRIDGKVIITITVQVGKVTVTITVTIG
ncbi:hypothetical protein [Allomeiothermus silvanus]|uniref:hypothetical protein n=1 Tax=Allomeiothermus silvanus TaxID=52022 RepID=UPI0023F26D2C|nr:hypothetical protein [Allomeiothermus silvanus]